MTPAKRKRLYLETKPFPGDLVKLPYLTTMWYSPEDKRAGWNIVHAETYVIVIAVCDLVHSTWFEWAYVMTVDGINAGWIKVSCFEDENAVNT